MCLNPFITTIRGTLHTFNFVALAAPVKHTFYSCSWWSIRAPRRDKTTNTLLFSARLPQTKCTFFGCTINSASVSSLSEKRFANSLCICMTFIIKGNKAWRDICVLVSYRWWHLWVLLKSHQPHKTSKLWRYVEISWVSSMVRGYTLRVNNNSLSMAAFEYPNGRAWIPVRSS